MVSEPDPRAPNAGPAPSNGDAAAPGDGDASGEEALLRVRLEKAQRVREAGRDPFTTRVAAGRRSLLSELRGAYAPAMIEPAHELRYVPGKLSALAGDASHVVLGRLMGRRGFGKTSFLDLRDRTGDLQLFAKKDVLGDAFDALADLDLGDHVEAEGRPMVTKKGELSLELTSLRLVTKAFRPPPDKWHGLTDVDLRYRRRYVDMVANPEVAEVIAARAIL